MPKKRLTHDRDPKSKESSTNNSCCNCTAHFLIFDMVLPKIPSDTDVAKFAKFLLPGGLLYSTIVLLPIWLFDKLFWRLFNPKYDISGVWEVSLYEL